MYIIKNNALHVLEYFISPDVIFNPTNTLYGVLDFLSVLDSPLILSLHFLFLDKDIRKYNVFH